MPRTCLAGSGSTGWSRRAKAQPRASALARGQLRHPLPDLRHLRLQLEVGGAPRALRTWRSTREPSPDPRGSRITHRAASGRARAMPHQSTECAASHARREPSRRARSPNPPGRPHRTRAPTRGAEHSSHHIECGMSPRNQYRIALSACPSASAIHPRALLVSSSLLRSPGGTVRRYSATNARAFSGRPAVAYEVARDEWRR